MRVTIKSVRAWLHLQLSKQPGPYSLCYQPVECLAVFQALRAQTEQQELDKGLGLERTPKGAAVPQQLPPLGQVQG